MKHITSAKIVEKPRSRGKGVTKMVVANGRALILSKGKGKKEKKSKLLRKNQIGRGKERVRRGYFSQRGEVVSLRSARKEKAESSSA